MRSLTTTLAIVGLLIVISPPSTNAQVPAHWADRCAVRAQGMEILLAQRGRLIVRDTSGVLINEEELHDYVWSTEGQRRTAKTRYPNAIWWTSATTPIVPGSIAKIHIDADGVVWMFNARGEMSRFDGGEWSLHNICSMTNKHERTYSRCVHDIAETRGTLRIATCSGIVEVDRRTRHHRFVVRIPFENTNVFFVTPDRIRCALMGEYFEVDLEHGNVQFTEGLIPDTTAPSFRRQRYRKYLAEMGNALKQWMISNTDLTFRSIGRCSSQNQDAETTYALWDDCEIDSALVPPLVRELLTDTFMTTHDWIPTCGVSNAMYRIRDIAIDRSENIYLATSKGVLILPNQAPTSLVAERILIEMPVHPSPAIDRLTIDLPPGRTSVAEVTILNITGTAVRTLRVGPHEAQVALPVEDLAPGAYQAVLRLPKSLGVARFLVSR